MPWICKQCPIQSIWLHSAVSVNLRVFVSDYSAESNFKFLMSINSCGSNSKTSQMPTSYSVGSLKPTKHALIYSKARSSECKAHRSLLHFYTCSKIWNMKDAKECKNLNLRLVYVMCYRIPTFLFYFSHLVLLVQALPCFQDQMQNREKVNITKKKRNTAEFQHRDCSKSIWLPVPQAVLHQFRKRCYCVASNFWKGWHSTHKAPWIYPNCHRWGYLP